MMRTVAGILAPNSNRKERCVVRRLLMFAFSLVFVLYCFGCMVFASAESNPPTGLIEFDGRYASPWVFQHGQSPLYNSPTKELEGILVAMEMSQNIQQGMDMDQYVQKMKDDGWNFKLQKTMSGLMGDLCVRATYILMITDYVDLCLVSNGGIQDADWQEEWESYFDTFPEENPIDDMGIKSVYIEIRIPFEVEGITIEDGLTYPLDLDPGV